MNNVKRTNLKGVRFVKIFIDIKKEYELTDSQALLFGYLYNWCMELPQSTRFCGFSDERIAEDLGVPIATHRRNLKTLLTKELVCVKNAGSRSKKKGESRELYINEDIFLSDEVKKQLDENEALKIQLAKAQQQLEEQRQYIESLKQDTPQITFLSKQLIKSGYVTEGEYMESWRDYNILTEQYCSMVGMADFNRGLSYIVNHIDKENPIRDKVSYLHKAMLNSAKRINKDYLNKDVDYLNGGWMLED